MLATALACTGGPNGSDAAPDLPGPCGEPEVAQLAGGSALLVCEGFAARLDHDGWVTVAFADTRVRNIVALPGGDALAAGMGLSGWSASSA